MCLTTKTTLGSENDVQNICDIFIYSFKTLTAKIFAKKTLRRTKSKIVQWVWLGRADL